MRVTIMSRKIKFAFGSLILLFLAMAGVYGVLNHTLIEAKMGSAESQYELAHMYFVGDGVQKNYEASIYWLHKSAQQGYLKAEDTIGLKLRELGWMYYKGKDVSRNDKKAMKYLRKAKKLGDKKAKSKLITVYIHTDVPNDFMRLTHKYLQKASMWWSKLEQWSTISDSIYDNLTPKCWDEYPYSWQSDDVDKCLRRASRISRNKANSAIGYTADDLENLVKEEVARVKHLGWPRKPLYEYLKKNYPDISFHAAFQDHYDSL